MLDLAYKYEREIREKMMNTWYDEKYMYYHSSMFHDIWNNPDGDWDTRQFVSLNSKSELLGVITYYINRSHDLIESFDAINFSKNKITFGIDLAQVIDDIFCKFNIRKIEFSVVVGNPIEKNYDKMITKYGGNITGIKHKRIKLIDNNYYDLKEYEIFRENYIKAKGEKI